MTTPFPKNLVGAASILMVLYILRHKKSYGYEMSNIILEASNGRIDFLTGSFYPLLKKMEKQGLIKSDWGTEDDTRSRKYYTILEKGYKKIDEHKEEFQSLISILNKLYSDDKTKIKLLA